MLDGWTIDIYHWGLPINVVSIVLSRVSQFSKKSLFARCQECATTCPVMCKLIPVLKLSNHTSQELEVEMFWHFWDTSWGVLPDTLNLEHFMTINRDSLHTCFLVGVFWQQLPWMFLWLSPQLRCSYQDTLDPSKFAEWLPFTLPLFPGMQPGVVMFQSGSGLDLTLQTTDLGPQR